MNSEQVANILAFYSYYHPKESVDDISKVFGLPGALVINGLYYGEQNGLFTAKKKGAAFKEIVVQAVPDSNADFGKDLERCKAIMYELITNGNSDKIDVLEENLFVWLGMPLVVSKVAVQLLINEKKLSRYWIRDAKDPKSKYYYYTLIENKDKFFARNEFKKQSKKGNVKSEPLS
jgi:hypothetical protein